MGIIVTMIVMWMLLPWILIPITIILYVKYRDLKRSIESPQQKPIVPVQQIVELPQQKPIPQVQQIVELPQQKPIPERVVTAPVVAKVDHTIHRIQASMIVGVLLLLASALIFATTTWHIMPQILKVILILSISFVFYAASFLSKKKFQLPITSMAFYQLGCFFTPIAILGIGVFRLLGDWFALEGLAGVWVFFTMAAVFSISTYIGHRIFSKRMFYALLQLSNCTAIFLVPLGLDLKMRWGIFFVLIYLLIQSTRFCIQYGNRISYELQPFLIWLCIYQGIFLLQLPRISGTILVGVCGILLFLASHMVKDKVGHAFRLLWLRWIALITLGTSVGVLLFWEEHLACMVFLFMWMAELIWNAYKREYKSEALLSVWNIILPMWLAFYAIESMNIFSDVVLLMGITSMYFLITLILILVRTKYRLAQQFCLPLLLVTGIFATGTLVDLYDYKISILVLWQVLLLLFLLRKEKGYEITLLLLGVGAPAFTCYTLGLSIGAYQLGIVSFTGLAYLFLAERKDIKSQLLMRIVGCTALYSGLLILLFEIQMVYDRKELDGNKLAMIVIVAMLILISQIFGVKLKKQGMIKLIQLVILPFVIMSLHYVSLLSNDAHAIVALVLALICMIVARRLYDRYFTWQVVPSNSKFPHFEKGISLLALSTLYGVGTALYARNDIVQYLGLCALLAYVLQFYKCYSSKVDQVLIWISLFLFYLMWVEQPFVEVPYEYHVEYRVVGFIVIALFLEVLRHWGSYVRWIQYGLISVCTLFYAGECFFTETLWKTLTLGITMVLVFVLGQYRKELRWLLLSLVTIVGLLFYVTRNFWTSLAWWVYLLVVGLLLIGVAIRGELQKGKEPSTKKRLENWKW